MPQAGRRREQRDPTPLNRRAAENRQVIRPEPRDSKPSPCPHLPNCAGCRFIGRPYGEQLGAKRAAVSEALAHHPTLARIEVPPVVPSPRAFGYRNQAKLVVRQARRGLLVGLYRPGTHQVVDIRACPVHHPLIATVLAAFIEAAERLAIQAYDERTQGGDLRYMVVRVSHWAKTAQVILVTRTHTLPHRRELVRALQRVRGVASVVQNVNPDPGNVILGSEYVPLTAETALQERIGGLKLKTRAGAFLQANVPAARKLYELALAWANPGPEDYCLDVYCGIGATTLFLAGGSRLALGIEESPIAVADATVNARLNGFHNVRFMSGDAESALPAAATRLPRVDIILLNPPRKGATETVRAAIVECRPRRIVYVSCAPDTLARDLDWFAARGYPCTRLQPFDFMPQTEHVECVALLEPDPA
ncbi:23S rRNA (uracil(1939)-C(5))-methyltransferase RlmD [Candidatus Binatia bacterium]|nr:23S rRNA (uracil(1939)-C(5))-methyltransferase RlmD [Candidatus Binatia bacterium]